MNAMWSRLGLRVGSLGLKFALTIIVARTLGFDAVAAYGFAVAASVVASKVLGLGFSTELNRRLSGDMPADAVHTAQRLFALYAAVYALLCLPLAVPALASGLLRIAALPSTPLWLIAMVACAEHAALEVNGYIYSLHRTQAATWLLFIRTGAWSSVAIMGLMTHMIVSIDAVLAIWLVTNIVVIAIGWMTIGRAAKDIPLARGRPVVPARFSRVWKDGMPFFVALLLLSVLQYLERFVAAGILTANELGRYVFVWSIANAIQTVTAATVVFAAAPRFVRSIEGGGADFPTELARSAGASLALSGVAAVGIFALRGPIFRLAHEGGDFMQTSELAILLLSFVLRALTDVLWAAAVALRAGRLAAIAMVALTLVCLPLSLLLIHHWNALGAACAHLAASIAVAGAMAWIVVSRTSLIPRVTRITLHAS